MHAIEFPVEIDSNQQIHLQLPNTVHAHKAHVIVMYEEIPTPSEAHEAEFVPLANKYDR